LYEAFSEGRASPLPELPIQYADFAVWQQGWLQGEVLEKQISYWKEQLAGVKPLELATDHPRPATPSFNGAAEEIKIDAATVEALKRLGAEQGVTLFMMLLAGFQVLLSRYSGQEDIVVGSGIANRARKELEGLIGFFINTLVMRTDLSGDPTVVELLQRVRKASLGAFEHQDLPFEILVKELQPERDLNRNPVFQVMFALQNAPQQEAEFTNLTFRPAGGADVTNTFAFDLALNVWERGQGISGQMMYNTDLFERETIRRMSAQLERVLTEMVAQPGGRISELELLSEGEREQMVVGWNATASEYPKQSIQELFEEQAARKPQSIAVEYKGLELTYEELNERANQLAHYLRRKGVRLEEKVGLCVERTPEMVVGLLGILKAGGAYVPLDGSYPTERLKYMLRDTQVRVVLSQQSLKASVDGMDVEVICLDDAGGELARENMANPTHRTSGENLAYVMYTSGSTGQPKGISVVHRGVVRLVRNTNYVELGSEDVVAQSATVSFDASTFEIWGALLNGGRVVMIDKETVVNPKALGEKLKQERVSTLFLTTAIFNQVAWQAPGIFKGVKQVMFGGEAVDVGAVRRILEEGGPERLLHVYGPTESTTFAMGYEVKDVSAEAATVPIGGAIGNTRVYLLNERMSAVPVGVVGEIYIGGDGLAREYVSRPDLTAERFVPDAFSKSGGERLYRTGDLGRYRKDGSIEFIGRKDHQVKIHGYRIELGEIESVLEEHECVEQAVVLAREDEPAQKRLVGYVVFKEGASATCAELRSYLKERLPEYMVLGFFVTQEKLPLTANGKVDRKALPAPKVAGGEGQYVPPRSELEKLIAGIWCETLQVETVGIFDDFFELGGHSFLAIRVITSIRKIFQLEVQLKTLFENPTVAGMSEWIRALRESGSGVALPKIQRANRAAPLPLSHAQERLWFINQLQPNSPAYNNMGALRIEGELDVGALERAINEIIRRHESLRTVFQMGKKGPVQVIGDYEWQALPMVDLGGLPDGVREQVGRELTREEDARPFDLSRGPLVRVRLLRLGPANLVILYTLHHIMSDGWSMGVLNRELETLYEAFSEGRASPLPELPIQYADFAVWQRNWLQGEVLERQLEYWKEQLTGLSPLQLLTDHPRAEIQTFNGGAESIALAPEAAAALKAMSQREGVTLFMTLLAGFQVLLGRYSGQEDIAVGSPIANRNREEIEKLIGFFANSLVMRIDLSGDPTIQELLERVKVATLGAHSHQDLPFEKVVEELQPERDLSRTPLSQVGFALQNAPDEGVEMKGAILRPFGEAKMTSRGDLEAHLWEAGPGIAGRLIYNTDLFEAGTIHRMGRHLERVWESFAENPRQRISEITLLSEAEREQRVAEWNCG
jgi:amino acid adenylation domain-containing protein